MHFEQNLAGVWEIHPAEYLSAEIGTEEIGEGNWRPITVPSNWYLQGVDQAGGSFWYRHRFPAQAELKGKRLRLVFQGVDYTADVWLNGSYLGFHEGYFGRFSFEVTDLLRFDRENRLMVLVKSPMEEPGRTWSLRKRQIKGILNHHDTRPGGAWSTRGQESNSGGIWGSVCLQASDTISLERVQVTPELVLESRAAVARIVVDTSSGQDADGLPITWKLELYRDNVQKSSGAVATLIKETVLKGGKNQLHFTLPVEKIKLWWPWEMGEPHLYRLEVSAWQGDRLLDSHSTRFGFREIVRDGKGHWLINGKRLFLRGTNYIGSLWLSDLTKEKLRKDLLLMKEANINAIRVHAHITAPEFYQLCDELGLLVWQDFPLQWGYEDSGQFAREVKRQAAEMIELLYNHPAIFAWCGHNEPPWDASWMQHKYPDYDKDQNRGLDEQLYNTLLKLDTSRYVHKHSATAEHPWLGWYSGHWLDYGKATTQPLITEFGAQALPGLKTLRTIFDDNALWPQQENQWTLWKYHNFQPLEMFSIAGVSKGNSLKDFIENSQDYQARLTQFAAESYRRQRYNPVSGIFQFMFVEHWPSINWGIVDYLRTPKPGYSGLQKAYQPLLPSLEYEKVVWQEEEPCRVGVWLINDLHRERENLTIILSLHDSEGQKIDERRLDASVKGDSKLFLGEHHWEGLAIGKYRLVCQVFGAGGRLLASNEYQFKVT